MVTKILPIYHQNYKTIMYNITMYTLHNFKLTHINFILTYITQTPISP